MEELKPCPFCGGEAGTRMSLHYDSEWNIVDDPGNWTVCCDVSGCMGEMGCSFYPTENQAVQAWNTRAERTCRNVVSLHSHFAFECSECGAKVSVALPTYREVNHGVNVCPSCGAKVVDR